MRCDSVPTGEPGLQRGRPLPRAHPFLPPRPAPGQEGPSTPTAPQHQQGSPPVHSQHMGHLLWEPPRRLLRPSASRWTPPPAPRALPSTWGLYCRTPGGPSQMGGVSTGRGYRIKPPEWGSGPGLSRHLAVGPLCLTCPPSGLLLPWPAAASQLPSEELGPAHHHAGTSTSVCPAGTPKAPGAFGVS